MFAIVNANDVQLAAILLEIWLPNGLACLDLGTLR